MILLRRFFLLAAIFASAAAWADAVVDARTTELPLDGHIWILEDPDGKMSLEEAQVRGDEFKPVQKAGEFNLGYTKSHWWMRIKVAAAADAPANWRLQLSYPPLDSVEAWLPKGASWQAFKTGDRRLFADRPIPNRNFVFPLHLTAGETSTLYLRVASEGTLTVPLQILSEHAYDSGTQLSYLLSALYVGMIVALGLYNLLLFLSIRDRTYLLYVLFVTGLAIGQSAQSGLAGQYLFPDYPPLANLAYPLGFALAGYFGTMFTRVFLDTSRFLPRLDKVLFGLGMAFIGGALISLYSYRYGSVILSATGILFSGLAVCTGVVSWRQGNRSARLFLLAWSLMLIGAGAMGLRILDIIPTSALTLYGLPIGSALEMLLLSFALADRINQMRRDKITAHANTLAAERRLRANLEDSEKRLEARVTERTRELEFANQRLVENEERFRQLAQHDSLTGLPNRLLLFDRLEHLLQRSRRTSAGFAVLMLDLDGFKLINDTHGHAAGDTLLAKVAERLQSRVRASDTVARIGGDEFTILLEQSSTEVDAQLAASNLMAALADPISLDNGVRARVGGSIGIALWPRDGNDAESLLHAADQAMYRAKANGLSDSTV